jgi:cytosine/adenosine deaminase-related metal-dependent hydrolase
MKVDAVIFENQQERDMVICGVRYASGPNEATAACLQIARGRITRISSNALSDSSDFPEIDLDGFLVMPGLINAHDHLEFALYPRLADPPYYSYVDWGEHIHNKFPSVIAMHHAVPKQVRVWWGGIRNLLCGVTTVSHHNPLWPELERHDFPVRVIQEYGWAHSFTLGGDLQEARAATPTGKPFIIHACEGIDERARGELWGLDRLGVLDNSTVLVHGLAIDREGVGLLRDRGASLVVCPTSNNFLFGRLPDLDMFNANLKVALGSDSPLTADGDLLDEIRFVIRACGIAPDAAYRMVTNASAAILRLNDGRGAIDKFGPADLIAVRDTGVEAAERLACMSLTDVEFVMIAGQVQLASSEVRERLPHGMKYGLEPLSIDGTIRWLRAPVKMLLQATEDILGKDRVRLGRRTVRLPQGGEVGRER